MIKQYRIGMKGVGTHTGEPVIIFEVLDDRIGVEYADKSCAWPKLGYADRNFAWENDAAVDESYAPANPVLRTDADIRKGQPVFSGVLAYFPDALKAVAEVSRIGNDQHNPGQPLHWARGKSADQLDAATRHLMDHTLNPVDSDGGYHLAKAAWRVLAELQLVLEKSK